ncbi:MAG: hypothetical protein P1V97_09400 [Planctomycetota bacterium]|nr:hypothetical protein [Planctomycetota bacterium]
MRTFLRVATLSTALLIAGPALACSNEPRTEYEEREFRSRYKKKKSQVTKVFSKGPANTHLLGGLIMGGLGLVLAVSGYRRAKRKDLDS